MLKWLQFLTRLNCAIVLTSIHRTMMYLKVIRNETDAAIDNSFNVLRTRIDRFGVAQPNIQHCCKPKAVF
jgi:preprotein translocase subunit SecD